MHKLFSSILVILILLVTGCVGPGTSTRPNINDSDGDGVNDSLDQCPSSIPGVQVDFYGCPIKLALIDVPSFQWPPPKPNAYVRFNSSETTLLQQSTFGEAVYSLESILKAAEYSEFSYYKVPTGIAMATQLERIHTDGSPYAVPERWNVSDLSLDLEHWSILNYLKTLVRANPGHYRVMVFLLTHENLTITFSKKPESEAAIRSFVENGAVHLPPVLRDKEITNEYGLTILVYEMKRPAQGEDAVMFDLGVSVKDHMSKTKISF